ncbi:methyltransferase domain-containing protein [bacterium]|nr:methyltransferase domain-containing protein [bacterium]
MIDHNDMVVFVMLMFALGLASIIVSLSLSIRIERKPGFAGLDPPRVVRAYDFMNRMPPFKIIRRLFYNALSRLKPQGTLVDVGCGPGYLLGVIARRIPSLHLVGVDLSDEILRQASRNLSDVAVLKLTLMKGDSENLPLSSNSVDYIVSTLSLHHWPHPETAFCEFHRVLKPGGTLLVFDLKRDAKLLFYFLIRLVTGVIAPKALRKVKEPLDSLRSSYTSCEVFEFMKGITWKELRINPGLGWVLIESLK